MQSSMSLFARLFTRQVVVSLSPCLSRNTLLSRRKSSRMVDTRRSCTSSSSSVEPPGVESTGQSSTLLVVGDVHNQWGDEDETAVEFVDPDMVIFVGDIGNEDVDLVRRIGSYSRCRKVVVLGNHDAWYSLTSRGKQRAIKAALQSCSLQRFSGNSDGVVESLNALGDCHIGYSSMVAEDLGLVFAGARPFSKGGMQWGTVADFYKKYYNVDSMEDSMSKILESILDEKNAQHALVVVAHNGPTGLGSRQEDPCGVDFMDPADDFGDPDLEEALQVASSCGRPASLVLFGHMHHRLKKGGFRNMVSVDDDGTVYLNAAVVPRTKNVHMEDDTVATSRHFVKVTMTDGAVQEASNIWITVHQAHDVASCEIAENQVIVKRSSQESEHGKYVVDYYKAHSDEWEHVIL